MHRIGEILETTDITQWRWVPSKMNPADLATKVQTRWEVSSWFSGPKFLQEDMSTWPTCNNLGKSNKEEIRHHLLLINKNESDVKFNIENFSNWKRLYRAISTIILYIRKLKSRCEGNSPPRMSHLKYYTRLKPLYFEIRNKPNFVKKFIN